MYTKKLKVIKRITLAKSLFRTKVTQLLTNPLCLSTPLWNNPNNKTPYRKECYRNVIDMIGDVFDKDLSGCSIEQYKTSKSVECNYFERDRIK